MFRSCEYVKKVKQMYQPGMRIRLLKMDDVQAPPVGCCGTVRGVDDVGQLMVGWTTAQV